MGSPSDSQSRQSPQEHDLHQNFLNIFLLFVQQLVLTFFSTLSTAHSTLFYIFLPLPTFSTFSIFFYLVLSFSTLFYLFLPCSIFFYLCLPFLPFHLFYLSLPILPTSDHVKAEGVLNNNVGVCAYLRRP